MFQNKVFDPVNTQDISAYICNKYINVYNTYQWL